MNYTIFGIIDERPVSISWLDGCLEGSPDALEELFALADVLEGKAVGPEPDGPFTFDNHLTDPLTTQILIEDILDEVTATDGTLPQPIEFPPSAAA